MRSVTRRVAGTGVSRWTILAVTLAVAIAGTTLGLAPSEARAGTVPPPTWSAPHWVSGMHEIVSVSCPSTSLCVAVDDDGDVMTSTNPAGGASAWTVADIDGTDQINSLSCPSTSLCVAVDTVGNILTSTDPTGGTSAWKTADVAGVTELTAVSCPSATLCIAGGLGVQVTSTDPAGGASAWNESSDSLDWFDSGSLACPSPTLCVAAAMTPHGTDMLTSTDPAGGAATWRSVLLPDVSWIFAMSCPTTSLCVTDASDSAFSYNGQVILSSTDPAGGGTTWKATPVTNTEWSLGLACASASLCTAFSENGAYYSTNPAAATPTWTYEAVKWPVATAVVCPSAWLCIAGIGSLQSNNLGGVEVGIALRSTKATLRLSVGKVRFGRERSERLSVTVRSDAEGVPGGKVIITAGALKICKAVLAGGKATCKLSSRQLKKGTYWLQAVYKGNSYFSGSKSPAAKLVIHA
jgi:hypothetical protein